MNFARMTVLHCTQAWQVLWPSCKMALSLIKEFRRKRLKLSPSWSRSQTPTVLLMSFSEVGINTGNEIYPMKNLQINLFSGLNLFSLGIEWATRKFPSKNGKKRSKKLSMRGADGWSVVELDKLPRPIFILLRHILDHAESCGAWRSLLTKTWVVLLPKVEGSLSWKEVRPISIASMLYRLYARIRTRQILNRLPPKVLPFVGLGTPTCVHWATLLDKIQFAYDSQGVLSGVVCDLLKAFNCLNRQVIHKVGMKGGIPTPILTAWAGSLKSLQRQVQIGGYLHGEQHSSSTGYPEGPMCEMGKPVSVNDGLPIRGCQRMLWTRRPETVHSMSSRNSKPRWKGL